LTKGLITKGIGGFYYVRTDSGICCCKGRGLFRKDSNILVVGDEVMIEEQGDGTGTIMEILPRKNVFIRPPVANLDQVVFIMALASPEPNFLILDRLLVMAEKSQIDIVIGFNKTDLVGDEQIEFASAVYDRVYPTVFLSGKNSNGIEELKPYLKDRKTAFAGPSGVGKSTLLNRLYEQLMLETGAISKKTSRGKHTTRHVELYDMQFGGVIFDTPGFTSFEVLDADEEELQFLFPEFALYADQCRFKTCRHINEPDCAIKAAVSDGSIHKSRYNSYDSLYKEIQEKRRY
jgi:ribosome biogenesis GTPase / thiamine phosphate phosphatase